MTMSRFNPINAFLLAHGSKSLRESAQACPAWFEAWVRWYDAQECLGVIRRGLDDHCPILGVGVCVQTTKEQLARDCNWVKDDPQGDVLWVQELAATEPAGLYCLGRMLQGRFPRWRELDIMGLRGHHVLRYDERTFLRLCQRARKAALGLLRMPSAEGLGSVRPDVEVGDLKVVEDVPVARPVGDQDRVGLGDQPDELRMVDGPGQAVRSVDLERVEGGGPQQGAQIADNHAPTMKGSHPEVNFNAKEDSHGSEH